MSGWIVTAGVVAAMAAFGAGDVTHGATPATAPAADARVAHLHDKDHPWDFKPEFADRAAWEKRAEFLRTQVLVAQGLWPMPPKGELKPVIHGKIDRDNYTIEKVYFASLPGHYVTGNLYRPKGKSGKLPAVLCPYGHWPDGRFIWKNEAAIKKEIDSGAEKDHDAAKTPLQANLAMLAQMGCVAFQYDMVGYGDDTKITHREGFLDVEATLRLQSFMGLQTWNSIRAMDFLLSLPDVDASRVAVTGSSSGGTQLMALDAVDPRASVAFPMVMVSMGMQGGCVCENAPLYRVKTNNVELATLFAPKPEGMAAANDWTKDFLTRGLPEMKAIWKLYGAEDHVWGDHVNFGHNHNLLSREMQYNFLNRELKLGLPEPVKEKPFVPVPPAELSVYDTSHPRPADETDAAGVRQWMTRVADDANRTSSNSTDPSANAKFLLAALRAMVVDELPAAKDVETESPVRPAGQWETNLSRVGAGERVPVRGHFPEKWNGSVVVLADSQSASTPVDAKPLLDSGSGILTVGMIGSSSFKGDAKVAPAASTKPNPNPPYLGYSLGYERSILGNRVHDLLSAIALAKGMEGTKSVRLIGLGDAGPAAFLARCLAGDAVAKAAIDMNDFDFDKVIDEKDPMLLPGGLKYGGIYAFTMLCASRPTLLTHARSGGRIPSTPDVVVRTGSTTPAQMVSWLTE